MTVSIHPDDLLISGTTKKGCNVYCICSVLTLCALILLFFATGFKLLSSSIIKDLEVVEIDSLTASNFSISSRPNQISANWNIQMSFKNMDKRGYFKFSKTKVSVYYNAKRIALADFKSFQLSSKNPPTHFGGEFSGSSGYVDDSIIENVGQGITAGNVKFNIVFKASVKKSLIKGWVAWKLQESDNYVYAGFCENVELFFESTNVSKARMLNGSHKCLLYHSYGYRPSDWPYCFQTKGVGSICV